MTGDEPGVAVINKEQAEALMRLLVESGDMTPMAVMQLRKLWSGRQGGTPIVVPHIDFDTPTGDEMVAIDKGFGGRSVGRDSR